MAKTKSYGAFFNRSQFSYYPSCGPITSTTMASALIFLAFTGTITYFSLEVASFCATLPQIGFKTDYNVTDITHTNATNIITDLETTKTFIDWFNQLELYDICFYGFFGLGSSIALTFSMSFFSCLLFCKAGLKKTPSEESERLLLTDATQEDSDDEEQGRRYAGWSTPPSLGRHGSSQQSFSSLNIMTV